MFSRRRASIQPLNVLVASKMKCMTIVVVYLLPFYSHNSSSRFDRTNTTRANNDQTSISLSLSLSLSLSCVFYFAMLPLAMTQIKQRTSLKLMLFYSLLSLFFPFYVSPVTSFLFASLSLPTCILLSLSPRGTCTDTNTLIHRQSQCEI